MGFDEDSEIVRGGKDIYSFCEMSGYTNEFYQRPEEDDRCYIPTSELAWLLRADHILECMAKCGIHNTQEYEDAMKMHRETYDES